MADNALTKSKKTKVYLGWIAKRAALAVFDVIAVYFSYFLALVMRFYANGEFLRDAHIYLKAFYKIIPYSVAAVVLIFALFGLYGSRWRYAGLHDLIRIILAHAAIFVLLFAVTYLFFERMPLTFYFLGTGMLFCLTCFSRFSLTIFEYLRRKYRGAKNSVGNVMIVGTGDTANYVRRLCENREENQMSVQCFFSTDTSSPNTEINGAPILDNPEKLDSDLKKYRIDRVYFADPGISAETVRIIKELCKSNGIETRDYSDALSFDLYSLSFRKLAKYVPGPMQVRDGENVYDFHSGEEAVCGYTGSGLVKAVSALDGVIVVEASSKKIEKNDTSEAWVKKTEADTGENISFF